MSAPHRNHVQQRAKGTAPARQYVSETHDHKPDAPGNAAPDYFVGTGFAVDEIELGYRVLGAKIRALRSHHDAKTAVAQKLAAEEIAKLAGQIGTLANVLVDVATRHINRRPRP